MLFIVISFFGKYEGNWGCLGVGVLRVLGDWPYLVESIVFAIYLGWRIIGQSNSDNFAGY